MSNAEALVNSPSIVTEPVEVGAVVALRDFLYNHTAPQYRYPSSHLLYTAHQVNRSMHWNQAAQNQYIFAGTGVSIISKTTHESQGIGHILGQTETKAIGIFPIFGYRSFENIGSTSIRREIKIKLLIFRPEGSVPGKFHIEIIQYIVGNRKSKDCRNRNGDIGIVSYLKDPENRSQISSVFKIKIDIGTIGRGNVQCINWLDSKSHIPAPFCRITIHVP